MPSCLRRMQKKCCTMRTFVTDAYKFWKLLCTVLLLYMPKDTVIELFLLFALWFFYLIHFDHLICFTVFLLAIRLPFVNKLELRICTLYSCTQFMNNSVLTHRNVLSAANNDYRTVDRINFTRSAAGNR